MRAIGVIAIVAAAILNVSLTSCQKEQVARSPVEQQDDQDLADRVKGAFANSPSFKFPDVQVAAYKGTVQLSGFVVSEDQKTAAENLARNVSGAQSVQNKISLKR